MIDIKHTILSSIKNKINDARFLGKNDTKGMRDVLSLIIIDDLLDWSDYLDKSEEIQLKLFDLRMNCVLHNSNFVIEYTKEPHKTYVNVNTPLTNDTWKRVWDAPDVIILDDKLIQDLSSINTTLA